jgi:hypothetical protein
VLRKNITLMLIVIVCLTLFLTGCGKANKASNVTHADGATPQVSAAPTPSVLPSATPVDMKQTKVMLYYGNETGDDIIKKEETLKYAANASLYITVLNALTQSSDPKAVPLLKGFIFNQTEFKGGLLTVDLTLPKASQLGSEGEDLMLKALKNTLFQFPEITTLEILVDGKKAESLLGHVELPHPITK